MTKENGVDERRSKLKWGIFAFEAKPFPCRPLLLNGLDLGGFVDLAKWTCKLQHQKKKSCGGASCERIKLPSAQLDTPCCNIQCLLSLKKKIQEVPPALLSISKDPSNC
jgi:hypothetical protein